MQVFVPEPESYAASVATLDNARLGKQRLETYQILMSIFNQAPVIDEFDKHLLGFTHRVSKSRRNHTATRSWVGHELALLEYQRATVAEWLSRPKLDGGVRTDTCLYKTEASIQHAINSGYSVGSAEPPWWWGRPEIHLSHRQALVSKRPEHYQQIWPDVPYAPEYEYIWPVSKA